MSEINAIATNNFLLATQQEVSHDNTLSGNGTSASPLGVVPGYNETVLFSSVDGAIFSGTNISLEESWFNFESIKMTTRFFNEGAGQKTITEIIPSDISPYQGVLVGGFNDAYGYTSASNPFLSKLTFHTNSGGNVVYLDKCWIQQWNSSAWQDRTNGRLYKVVGINRKA